MGGVKLDEAEEYFYDVLLEAMHEVEMELVGDELYEKACVVRDEIIQLKKNRELQRIAKYTGRKVN
jgi:protein-arginine kinase activator protein McsA